MGTLFDLDKLNSKSLELNSKIQEPNFYSNRREAQKVIDEFNLINEKITTLKSLKDNLELNKEALELLKEEFDETIMQEVESSLLQLEKDIDDFSLLVLLNGEYDKNNCYIDIHPGAGGTESQDWADMLYRMYVRYAEANNFKLELISFLEGEEAGIKSVSFLVKGKNAYGYLKGEKGVHRLVRISPFDASKRRHTSFASVEVTPEIDSNIDIEIEEKDIRIDTYRSSGAGGQNVNKTDSAVRITHFPTGIVVTCQNQRNQIQNRETAMNILKSRLYLLKEQEQKKKISSLQGEQKNIEWGSQIRSYVFCPYTMVKDHRTECVVSDVKSVLDGNLEPFIKAYLRFEVKQHD